MYAKSYISEHWLDTQTTQLWQHIEMHGRRSKLKFNNILQIYLDDQ